MVFCFRQIVITFLIRIGFSSRDLVEKGIQIVVGHGIAFFLVPGNCQGEYLDFFKNGRRRVCTRNANLTSRAG